MAVWADERAGGQMRPMISEMAGERQRDGRHALIPRVAAAHWIQSPLWDLFWIFAAIWGSALLFVLAGQWGWSQAATVLFAGNVVLATLHSYSTTFMILGSARLREARARERTRLVYGPLALALGSVALGLYLGWTLSFPKEARYGWGLWPWVLYLGLFWAGHFWHFGKQDFGVLSIYRARAGQRDDRARRIDLIYAWTMMMGVQPIVYLSTAVASPLGEAFYNFVPITPASMTAIANGAFAVAYGVTLVVVCLEVARPNASVPKILYYLIMLVHPSLVLLAEGEMKLFYFTTYLWSHWFVAIGLVARLHTRHFETTGDPPLIAATKHWLIIGAIASLALLLLADLRPFSVFNGREYREILGAVTPEQRLFVGFALGVLLAEQLVHYVCDRMLFRLRDPEIRSAIGELL